MLVLVYHKLMSYYSNSSLQHLSKKIHSRSFAPGTQLHRTVSSVWLPVTPGHQLHPAVRCIGLPVVRLRRVGNVGVGPSSLPPVIHFRLGTIRRQLRNCHYQRNKTDQQRQQKAKNKQKKVPFPVHERTHAELLARLPTRARVATTTKPLPAHKRTRNLPPSHARTHACMANMKLLTNEASKRWNFKKVELHTM